ncbi:peptidoglycan DD-metalloendopeptidase family protein [Microbulbifer sp. OS29]|uniref:Peptidoglycan DD-metalloendopeptidase family protein n=1 Tax=Microbulbifer okhotskensis TaxID=2926617 RepID=A0A9X2EMR2_9GAMM|nr:peptidoglycan DD-metalloendopeptidase family protein [Microbulbifer okhotskensis]
MFKILGLLLLLQAVSSCSNHKAPSSALRQPPSIKITHHTVSKGDTLYSIAWRYGKDFRQLARTNGIPSPYYIYPGQRIKLTGSARSGPTINNKKKQNTPAVTAKPKKIASASAKKSLTQTVKRQTSVPTRTGSVRWHWPAKGKVISRFRSGDPLRKGVDIAGEKGESVLAAADGTVIYAGNALRGYGKLLIVKHNEVYLSAYAHNHRLLVKEGSRVKVGQRIAELGSSGTDRNKLHFEIRKNGQPVDPLAYLP